VLVKSAAHAGLDTADESLLTGVISAEVCLLNTVLDLVSCEELALLKDLLGALLQLLAKRAESVGFCGTSVGADGQVGDVVLHPVDVEGTRLGTVDARLASFLG